MAPVRVKRNKWDSGPSKPQDAPGNESDTPESLRRKAQAAAARLMARRQHEQAMCEEIIINDHAIHIRDQLTRRAALVSVEQQTGTMIVVKGQYYPPGAHRAPNHPPLLLHITAAQHVGPDEQSKRIAVSRAAAHIQAILRGQATPMSPVPPHPGSRGAAPPPDMLFRPVAQHSMLPMQPGMPPHHGLPPSQPPYIAGPPSHPHPLHATYSSSMHVPPMGMLGPVPHQQVPPGPGPAQPSQCPVATSATCQPPMHAPPNFPPAAAHPVTAHQPMPSYPQEQRQLPYPGQPLQHVLHTPSTMLANMSDPRHAVAPTASLPHPAGAPMAVPPHPVAPGLATQAATAQPGSESIIHITFSGPPGFSIEQQVRGPANSYLSHIERETGATIELRGSAPGPNGSSEPLLQISICHPDPWRRKTAEDLIHSLLQTVRSAAHASASPVAAPAAPQLVPPPQHTAQFQHAPHATTTAPSVPAAAPGHPGAWPDSGSIGPPSNTQPTAYGRQPSPGHLAMPAHAVASQPAHAAPPGVPGIPPQPAPSSAQPGPLVATPQASTFMQKWGPTAAGQQSGAGVQPAAVPGVAPPPAGVAAPSSSGGAAAVPAQSQDKRPQPAKRKFREFKEQPRNTQSRTSVLPSYYKHLAGGAADGTADCDNDGVHSEDVVYGPHGPEEASGDDARGGGLGAHRPANSSAAQPTPAALPAVGESLCGIACTLFLLYANDIMLHLRPESLQQRCWSVCRHVLPGRMAQAGAGC
eukprot:jgi/Ulvmu1/4371/UM002_0096.1